ncbi:hypothetical protein F2Q69_00014812 [Brassica cretica]|uniref:Uncharacterized protein n=1 Tax=Brassica cretica TaxID=69181 RepID=A0A8S9R138_BRACR|nr:hypothetical protein F2Q69_00014812 [Brassica cretica]
MDATKMFLIRWYSSSTHLKTTSRKSSRRLQGSLLDDFQEVFQTTSWKSSGLHGSLLTKSPFHNRSERFAQPLVTKQKNRSHFYEYSPSKSSESSEMLEVVWTTSKFLIRWYSSSTHLKTTSRKSSRRLPRSLPDDFLKVFQTTSISVVLTSWKSSGLVGSRLDIMEVFARSLPFIIDISVLVFNQMVLIFHSFKELKTFDFRASSSLLWVPRRGEDSTDLMDVKTPAWRSVVAREVYFQSQVAKVRSTCLLAGLVLKEFVPFSPSGLSCIYPIMGFRFSLAFIVGPTVKQSSSGKWRATEGVVQMMVLALHEELLLFMLSCSLCGETSGYS